MTVFTISTDSRSRRSNLHPRARSCVGSGPPRAATPRRNCGPLAGRPTNEFRGLGNFMVLRQVTFRDSFPRLACHDSEKTLLGIPDNRRNVV